MEKVFQELDKVFDEWVICGSWALWNCNMNMVPNSIEIDIIVDVPEDYLDSDPRFKRHTSNKFGSKGWYAFIDTMHVDIFNKPLPDYTEGLMHGRTVKFKTKEELKKHYLSLDIDNIPGHDRFKKKMRETYDKFVRSES